MRKLWLGGLAATAPLAALACDGEVFLACTISDGQKAVEVCYADNSVSYAFGEVDAMDELHLSVPVAEAELVPWPGIGRAIWEEIVFRNGAVTYTVYGVLDRVLPESDEDEIVVTRSGGVVVSEGETELAHLECDTGSVDFPWGSGIHDAKAALGLCFDRSAGIWTECTN